MSVQSMIWLAILVILLIIELITMGLTTIWFAGGALAAFLISLFYGSWPVQIMVFLSVSILLLLLTRPLAVKYINRNRTRTNADSLIGLEAIVTETIDNLAFQGQVQVSGQEWSARALMDSEKIEKGSCVRILEIRGVKLIVERRGDIT